MLSVNITNIFAFSTALFFSCTAYNEKANEIFNNLLSKTEELQTALERGFQYLQHVPILAFGKRIAEEIISALSQRSPWDSVSDRLQLLKEVNWSITERTPLRKRAIEKLTRPRFFNPLQLAADILSFMATGKPKIPHNY